MAKISSFNFITLNGYLNAPGGDISWHRHGEEENQFAAESMQGGDTLLFGRKTYEMMASYWPTPMAMENDPTVTAGMNSARKIVVSQTLKKAAWNNTSIISGNALHEIKRLKSTSDNDITILGSGSIVNLLTENSLIDEYLVMIDPVALDAGTTIFRGIGRNIYFRLKDVKTFSSGVVLLRYILQ